MNLFTQGLAAIRYAFVGAVAAVSFSGTNVSVKDNGYTISTRLEQAVNRQVERLVSVGIPVHVEVVCEWEGRDGVVHDAVFVSAPLANQLEQVLLAGDQAGGTHLDSTGQTNVEIRKVGERLDVSASWKNVPPGIYDAKITAYMRVAGAKATNAAWAGQIPFVNVADIVIE